MITKLVNGERVEMTPEEESEFEAARTLPPEQELEQERARMKATRFQTKAALHQAKLLEQVEALMSDTEKRKQFEWQDKQVFTRNSPTLNWAATQIGLTETDVDDLFRQAMAIEE